MQRNRCSTLALAATLASVGAAYAGLVAIELRPERQFVRADGRSRVLLLATLRDEKGAVVADGTRVRFAVSGAGRLENDAATTTGGVARATLIAPDQPGITTVTANLDSLGVAVPATTSVTFTNDTDLVAAGSNWVRIDGKRYSGYAVGIAGRSSRLVYADGPDGGASLRYRGLRVTADRIQLDVTGNDLIAEGNVHVTRGKLTLRYELLAVNLASALGTGYREEVPMVAVSLTAMTETLMAQGPPRETWKFVDFNQPQTSPSGETQDVPPAVTVLAGSISVEPGVQVQFRNATVYLNGQRALHLPLYVMSLNQQSLYREQVIGAGPNGIAFDFPYYYDVGPRGIGTLHVRRGAQYGSSLYSVRPGWNLDLDQVYNGSNGMLGSVQVLGLTARERGVRLQHSQKLGTRTEATLFADAPSSRSFFASSQLTHGFHSFHVSALASGSGQRYRIFDATGADPGATVGASQGDLRTQLLAETNPRPLGKHTPFQYTFSAEQSQQRYFGTSATIGTSTTENVGARFFGSPIPLGTSGWNLNQTFSVGRATTHGGTGIAQQGISLLGTSTFGRRVRVRKRDLGGLSLAYDYTQQPVLTGLAPGVTVQNGRQRVRLGTYLEMGGANLTLSASRGLDTTQSSLLGDLGVSLGGPWRTRVRVTDARTGGVNFRDVEFSLGRLVGQNEVSVYYSTVARRFQLDLTGARF